MLTLYYTPLSVYSRPVWIALLEKKLTFELKPLQLNGDQYQSEFLRLNPFNHVPVLVDDDFQIVESLAILDYLEAKYPTPALLPTEVNSLTTVRMVEMVTMNELLPVMIRLIRQHHHPLQFQQAKQLAGTILTFFEDLLGDRYYFGNNHITLAEVVAGTVVPWLPNLGVSLDNYPILKNWSLSLMQRQAWVTTQPTPERFEEFKRRIRILPRVRQNQLRQIRAVPSAQTLQLLLQGSEKMAIEE
jgi:glutathione S-transferase